jgi:hypothetical protein
MGKYLRRFHGAFISTPVERSSVAINSRPTNIDVASSKRLSTQVVDNLVNRAGF